MAHEDLLYSNYRRVEKTRSVIDPHAWVWKETGFHCPSCRAIIATCLRQQQELTHTCGLRMQRFGNVLRCFLPAGKEA